MSGSQELFEKSLNVVPGGVHSPVRSFKQVGGTPVFFKSATGCKLLSVEGKEYIDMCQSFGPLLLGHRDPDVQEEVMEAVKDVWTLGACEPYSVELAQWMVEHIPFLEKVRFVNSGTEAVMSALRVARAATGREKILKFNGCYHGHFDSLLVKAGSGLAGETAADSAGISATQAEQTVLCELDNDQMLKEVFENYGQELAAVIIEPLPANYGLLPQRKEFIDLVVKMARDHGALVIFDEVISGFRVALGGMAQELAIDPDLVTYGKVIGGGFPVGCFGGKAKYMDLVAPLGPVYQAGTLSANPIGMRAGLSTLKKAVQMDLFNVLTKRAQKFASELNQLFEDNLYPLQVVQKSSLFWLHPKTEETVRSPINISKELQPTFAKLYHELLAEGVYFAPNCYEVGFIGWAHTEDVLSEVVQKFKKALERVYAE